ncbi:MAG TPA: lamin tail domain-containing protein, partial [Bacteroidia bacterium]|nr:lamin tail domain-containing protein [Bacteroidia bacterium]
MYKLVLCLLLLPVSGSTQILSDDFSDGDFTHNPVWTGDSDRFLVNSLFQLQLHDNTADTAVLATAFALFKLRNQEWRFYIRENFSPSGNNNGRVYLVSDQKNLKDSLNGYYLQFGEAGSNDAIELFRQQGLSSVSVCRGNNAEIASAFAITVRVTRDSTGAWKLYADTQAGSNYQLEASGTDTMIHTSAYFGVWAKYTVSDASKFYWDDVYAGPVFIDHTLPLLLSLQTVGSSRLDAQFNLIPDSLTSCTRSNYRCFPGQTYPDSVIRDAAIKNLFHLYYSVSINANKPYVFYVSGVCNRNGDRMKPDTIPFWRYLAQPFDVVINEIMANPNPPVNLPPYEYIELYNRRSMPIVLDGWTLTQGKKVHPLMGVSIAADSFLLVCSATAAAAFDPSLPVYALPGFSALNNTGEALTLRTDSGRVMHAVTYSDKWYTDAGKKNGGWSLEQADPSNPCGGASNWMASQSPDGGTPCKRNSVFRSNPDIIQPVALRVGVLSPDTLCLYFNEPMDSITLLDKNMLTLDNGLMIKGIQAVGSDYSSIYLLLNIRLQHGVVYTLGIQHGEKDCSGNVQTDNQSLFFAIPEPPSPGDAVINEILADEPSGGEKYIELYNRSGKILDFKNLDIAALDSITGLVTDLKSISTEGYLFFPGDYIALSKNGNTVKKQYHTCNPDHFIDVGALPKMDIGSGSLALLAKDGTVIDQVTYTSAWQFPLLSHTKGVSLERVDYNKPAQDAGNWHSAAETAGFGTPACRNSEWMQGGGNSALSLENDIFSPDEDGYQDILDIHYHLDAPGYVGSINIFSSKGVMVRTLMKNILLGEEGSVTWDGTSDTRLKAPIGIYL